MASVFVYSHLHFKILWFIVLLFTIGIFMLGYLVNPKVGAHVYNIGHSFIVPSALLILGVSGNSRIIVGLAIIWFAHIAWDRAFGYGLKLETGFKDTHLGHLGKK
ncbi:MAG: DUF4260 domain-containing protein [Candidatus Saccharimonadales bacterium]